jgi:(p)ppGpp synthase/HD superfamily hydrolase
MHHTTSLVPRARALAMALHDAAGHTRSGGEPYWHHPERVAQTLTDNGLPEEVIAAAWLHDVPEDCPTDEAGCQALLRMIARDFGPVVGELVREVTNYFGPEASMEAKQARLREHAAHMSPHAKWIKLADRLDNISGMIGWTDEKKTRYAKSTFDLLSALEPLPEGTARLAMRILEVARDQPGSLPS